MQGKGTPLYVFYFTQRKGAWNALQLGCSGGARQKDLLREALEASVGYTVSSQPDWTAQ